MSYLKEKIFRAIELCNDELEKRKNRVDGESTEDQLRNVILPELVQLLGIIDKGQYPAKDKRFLNSFANAFTVWGWSMQNPTELYVLLT